MANEEYLQELSNRIDDQSLRIAVIGLGYVGLPTAISFHKAGFHVLGIDSSISVIDSLKRFESTIVDEAEMQIPSDERWEITSEYGTSIQNCDLAIVCVPTPVDANLLPDIGYVRSAIESIISSGGKQKNLAIVLESTVQPGTTRDCISETIASQGEQSGKIMMAYCPERVSPGEGGFGVGDVGRVIGSEDSQLTNLLSKLYQTITSGEVKEVSSIEVAEAAKLVENTQRDIDIAFSNELAILLPKLGLDVEEVLEAASTKWNFHRHTPGIGVGGHCIPIDPHYYIEISKRYGVSSAMSPAARDLNSKMPIHSANEVIRLCEGVAPERVLVLGFSYKPNVSDCRETPVIPLINKLLDLGVSDILVWDPLVENSQLPQNICPISNPYEHEGVDCVVIATAHDEVTKLNWSKLRAKVQKNRIFDGRRCLPPSTFIENGWIYHAIGRPWK